MVCARVIIKGIVIIDSTVLKDTTPTDNSISWGLGLNFAANIVESAATGAEAEITRDIASVFSILNAKSNAKITSGKATSRKKMVNRAERSPRMFLKLLFARW